MSSVGMGGLDLDGGDPLSDFAAPTVDSPPAAPPPPATSAAANQRTQQPLLDMDLFADASAEPPPTTTTEPTRVSAIPDEVRAALAAPPQSMTPNAPAPEAPRQPSRVLAGLKRALPMVGAAALVAAVTGGMMVPVGEGTVGTLLLAEARHVAGMGAELQPHSVIATYWTPAGGKPLLLLVGEVTNNATSPAPAVVVRAELRDPAGAAIKHEEGYAGHLPEELDLAALMTRPDTTRAQKDLVRKLAGQDLAPHASWPFVIIVADPPAALARGTVEITAHRGDPPGARTAVDSVNLEEAAPAPR